MDVRFGSVVLANCSAPEPGGGDFTVGQGAKKKPHKKHNSLAHTDQTPQRSPHAQWMPRDGAASSGTGEHI